MLRVTGSEILEYRKVIEERKNDVPIWERKVLTFEEAAAYSGIGISRLRKMATSKNCTFAIADTNRLLITREKFDKYMDEVEEI